MGPCRRRPSLMPPPEAVRPTRYPGVTPCATVRARFGRLDRDRRTILPVRVAGRVRQIRRHGGIAFVDLADATDALQLVVEPADLPEPTRAVLDTLATGDLVGADGTVMTTRRGELSVHVSSLVPLGHTTAAPNGPGGTSGDAPPLGTSCDAVQQRSAIIGALRAGLQAAGFTEIDAAVLAPAGGGGDPAVPVRASMLPQLEQLVATGLERVGGLGPVAADRPPVRERTVLEAVQAYADGVDALRLTGRLLDAAARAVGASPTGTWARRSFTGLLTDHVGRRAPGADPTAATTAQRLGVEVGPDWCPDRVAVAVFRSVVEPAIAEPTVVEDVPAAGIAVALGGGFLVVAGGRTVAYGFPLVTDAETLRSRIARPGGPPAPPADRADAGSIRRRALGFPPAARLHVDVDALVETLTGEPSRAIAFPASDDGPDASAPGGADTAWPPEMVATIAALTAPANPPPPPRKPRTQLAAALVALYGLLSVGALVPGLHGAIEPLRADVVPFELRVTSRVTVVLIGLALLFLADQLRAGKRRAWQLAVLMTAVSVALQLFKGLHLVGAALSVVVLAVLLLRRREFTTPSDPPSALRLVRVGPVYLAAVYGFGLLSLYVGRADVVPSPTFLGSIATVTLGLVGIDGPYEYRTRFLREFFPAALLAMGLFGIAALAWFLFRPLSHRDLHREEDWQHAWRLVHAYGWDTLAHFALRADKSFFFASDGEAMVAYTYVAGYALVSGDPIGRPESIAPVVDEFLTYCRARSWEPAFLAVREADLGLYQSRGLHAVYLGDEAIVPCGRIAAGHYDPNVERAVRRVGRTHHFELVRESEVSSATIGALNEISRRWRGEDAERGFTMTLSEGITGTSSEYLLAIARDEAGRASGFLRIVPVAGIEPGYTLDLMRHDPDAPNGITEYLIVHTATELAARGARRLSLNFAVWGRLLAPDLQHGALLRTTAWGIRRLNRFFQIESLRRFNAKFEPVWLPRSIVYSNLAHLPRVALLYAAIEGFVELPFGAALLPPTASGPGDPGLRGV